ncbi:hypothetical protein CAI21_20110 [Alkalilimnicola ehrlichii]|uniref:Transmembrane protein n=1 Tax=Alkalilimnicola ehrlichii TaxID=351052 RepID=A0A3E0X058_9GAMM|nr:hypothetical protein [Alkalilimnicola ehrlichii]RFA25139.1 hypothetical protein CAI21_20110 [Alkalilimnicola ehrlichii]RFA38804.1 hypothetical protein CAL65_02515 [Alkalilimnicola ehrlichii]
MSIRGAAVLGLRLLAILLLVLWLFRLPELALFLLMHGLAEEAPLFSAVVALAVGLPPLLAAFLWFGVGRLADVILPPRTAQGREEAWNNYDAQVVAYSAIGIFLVIWSLPSLVRHAYLIYQARDHFDGWANVGTALWLDFAIAGLQTLLALALVLGATGLAVIVARLRRLGAAS